MANRFQRPSCPFRSSPRHDIVDQPVAVVGHILQSARGKEPVFPSPGIRQLLHCVLSLPKDPIRSGYQRTGHAPQPLLVSRHEIVVSQPPHHPPVILVIGAVALESPGREVEPVIVGEVAQEG